MKKIFYIILLISLTFSSFASTKWIGILDSGMEDFHKGQYSFSITNLKKYLLLSSNDSNRAKALYYIALSYYFENKLPMAKMNLDELISRYRSSEYGIQAFFWVGLINQNEKNWVNAEEAFLRFINLMPGSDLLDRAYLAVANCQFEQGKFDESLKTLGIIITNDKSDKFEEASVLFSYILIKQNDIENGISFLTKWVERINEQPEKFKLKDRFWLYLAELYINSNDDKNAYPLLKNIDNFTPGSPSSDIALLRLSEIESRAGNTSVANEYIKRLNIEYPNSVYNIDALVNSGISLFIEKLFNQSIDTFKTSISAIDKEIAKNISEGETTRLITLKSKAILYLSESLINLKRIDNAIENLNLILDNNYPNIEEAVLKILELYIEKKDLKKIESVLKKYETIMTNSKKKERFDILYATYLSDSGNYTESIKRIDYIEQTSLRYLMAEKLKVKNYIALKNNVQALKILKELLAFSNISDRADIVYNIMTINFNTENYNEVIKMNEILPLYIKYLTSSQQLSLSLKTDYLMGLSYMQNKEYKKGIDLLKRIVSLRDDKSLPESDIKLVYNSFYYLAWMYYKISDFKNASNNFATASVLQKDEQLRIDSLFMEAWSYYSAENYLEASDKFIKIYELYKPKDIAVKSLLNAGKSYQNINNKKNAIEIFNKIYTEYPKVQYRPDAIYELIKYSFADKKIIDANNLINTFTTSYKDNPLYKSVLILQMENFLNAERYSEVLTSALNFINTIPESNQYDTVFYWAAYSGMKIKDFETAEKYFNYILSNFKSSTFYENSLKNLISIYNETNQYDKELLAINNFLKLYKDDENYKRRISTLNKILEGVSEEEALLLTLSETGDLNAKYKLAILIYKKGDTEKSIELLKLIRDSDNGVNGALANNFLGDIEFRDEKYKESLVIYASSISKYKGNAETNAEALYKTAYCYYKLDSKEQALKLLGTLNEKYPDNKWKPNAEALMRSLK